MPQLIAMVIVVVGAMIYMFQTFGGTGDKIEGVAQKSSIMTEINNIKNGLDVALRSNDVTDTSVLKDLAELGYFANQINNEVGDNTGTGANILTNGGTNAYSAISFGGENSPSLLINLVVDGTVATDNTQIRKRPGIRVVLLNELADNATFLESQITADLEALASIDRTTTDGSPVALNADGDVPAANRASAQGNGTATTNLGDGIFTIYFKSLPATVQQ